MAARSRSFRILNRTSLLSLILLPCLALAAWAASSGSVSGTVRDANNAVIAGATVTATNTATGVTQQVTTNARGYYSFPDLAVGSYNFTVVQTGFETYSRTGIAVDVNSAVIVDAVLQVGQQTQQVTVSENATRAETSDTQLGQVIGGSQMNAMPLNGRSITDLLALQPGVAPETSLTADTQQDVGVSALSPSGDLDPGTISINGQREFANAFIVNGSDVEEDVNAGTAIVPNLDSIAEFRILTDNFNAEYGGYSGGQINVVTKSGTNQLHGDVFEFLRNTDLDARDYFSPARGAFDQNQFGGTLGGPILKDRVFFFADYQGTRMTEGIATGDITVPSMADRSGDLGDVASQLTGTVSGTSWANQLTQELGYAVAPGEPYYTPGCTTDTECVLPNATIPTRAWSAPAKALLQYIPSPNVGSSTFATSAENETLRDDKGAMRLDANTRWGQLSAYYFLDNSNLNNPYPVAQSGASVPGFNALYLEQGQLVSLGDTKTFGSTEVNAFNFSFMRDNNNLGQPVGGVGVSLASQGFVTGAGTPGIVPLDPQNVGVENIVFNNYSIGTNANQLMQVNNTYQWIDNFTKVVGRHSLQMGINYHYDQINTDPIAQGNGNFLFTGSETGVDFADFLLGVPSQYNQSQLLPFYGRNQYVGLYVQDSWRARSNLTLNYGLRWDRIEPWYEKNNGISTFDPGQQSVVFPGAPAGILFPTDPGVPRTLAPAGNLDFAPRLGLAWAPSANPDSWLGKLMGGEGKTSIRAGAGMFYTSIEGLSLGILAANPPFGDSYSSPAPPEFSTPFVTAATGQDLGQTFPLALVSSKVTNANPDADVNWAQYEPITGVPGYAMGNRIPYVDSFMLSLERQFGSNTVLDVSAVSTQGRRELVLEEANPGNPALCLSLSQPSEVAADSPTCGPFAEGDVFTTASGQVINGTRGPLGADFGSNTDQATIGRSNYNALEMSLRHTSANLIVSAGYTWANAMDDASNLGEEANPSNPSLSYALSAFDIQSNFVVSYVYLLPLHKLFGAGHAWAGGWELSGITHFSTGFPVTLVNYGDNSLLGAEPNGINNYGIDEPDYSGAALDLNSNPRNGQPYFNPAAFSENALGSPGNASRRFFFGPGMDNYDMSLQKTIPLAEARSIVLRLEGFNAFNHAQFFGPATVDGNISSPTFGDVIGADSPRLVQLGAKFYF